LGVFKKDPQQHDDTVTLEGVMKELMIFGTPNQVADQIHSFQGEVGQFGTLLYAGVDWKDPTLAKQSMVLMAEKVMPQLQKKRNDMR
jgi:alkanesulfonate monooxygenase SsuD/methylene tetrahydromethanopterin reductase-like flavin-dependent oxidoreductase (luciferase family)